MPGEPGRATHAACCFNQCEEYPKLLFSGGVDKDKKMLGDMWILDVDHCKWTGVRMLLDLKIHTVVHRRISLCC